MTRSSITGLSQPGPVWEDSMIFAWSRERKEQKRRKRMLISTLISILIGAMICILSFAIL